MYEVYWNEPKAKWEAICKMRSRYRIESLSFIGDISEIVGNVHDNSELMEV